MIPTTALVEADGKQLVFVQYENFYEPIEVTTGMTDGDLIQVTEKLSVGEKLVTEGSLMLYAQSRKTQPTETTETTETAPTPAALVSPDPSHAQADAQGIPHQHDTAGNMANSSETGQAVGIPIMVIVGGMVGLLVGGTGLLFLLRSFNLRKKNSRKSRNKEISKPEHSYRE
jgi:cation efflux system membrane fusion protein